MLLNSSSLELFPLLDLAIGNEKLQKDHIVTGRFWFSFSDINMWKKISCEFAEVKALSRFLHSILTKTSMYSSVWSSKHRMELQWPTGVTSSTVNHKHLQQSFHWLSGSYITIDGLLKRVTCSLLLRITVARLFTLQTRWPNPWNKWCETRRFNSGKSLWHSG